MPMCEGADQAPGDTLEAASVGPGRPVGSETAPVDGAISASPGPRASSRP